MADFGRVTQEAVETIVTPTGSPARVTQTAVESIVTPANSPARVSQVALEALVYAATQTRFTQYVIEVICQLSTTSKAIKPPTAGRTGIGATNARTGISAGTPRVGIPGIRGILE